MAAVITTLLGNFLNGPVLQKILSFIPDPVQKAQAQLAMGQLAASEEAQQLSVDLAEAQSSDWFTRDWRPFVGWTCATAFAVNYVFFPLIVGFAALFGHKIVLPPLDIATMMPVLLGMLGLGAYHTVEKVQGVL